ncbi:MULTISPECIES: YqiA/YcfP family alpha/beta fold hydrolase [Hydrocarboniphaga]|jgi:alpha/beta superfamily hydrolase|uniref:AB hydrolase-1 domain-containing protein n=1 Tax=Hydrocarboniphaga effusa AP103 TaxID=1172194 RepID=I7ZEY6_9GAMM|nr:MULTISPECIES: YqiA/YcfP family alpha/beta fold hydrolase [Hydrocarboniphaga]EIT70277.1 hypothetical protein WQQ_04140 [Hydrocarboniphaga effusa AP103]MDZ4077298.1 YqiA/YcfP family alpha/beta fold hydrolase [Hydrocarboniphaga sp.]
MTPDKLVCFAHGKESGPWGIKIKHLAAIAREQGFDVMSPDYSQSVDPDVRVSQLIGLAPKARCLVLVGSSMGGYVSAMACETLRPTALMLLAPALYFPGWDREPAGIPDLCAVVHGWGDEIVPYERGLRFARRHKAALHLLDSDHSLNDKLPELGRIFASVLEQAAVQ